MEHNKIVINIDMLWVTMSTICSHVHIQFGEQKKTMPSELELN